VIRPSLVACGVVSLLAAISGWAGIGAGWTHPARVVPVISPVLLGAGGRVITARGVAACGRRPLLVAHSYATHVTLTWINPDTHCTSEAIRPVLVSTRLPAPLGGRALIQASTGRRIVYKTARKT
jgi:uncharacterized membrane protein YtjA (UPF0391 family)